MNGVGFLLRCSHPQASSRIYSLQKADIIIGRAMECDVVLDAVNVSRQHARIQFTAQGIFLTDLGSTNGTFVNDARITANAPQGWVQGTPLRIADYQFKLELASAPEQRASAASRLAMILFIFECSCVSGR